jgi:3'(2'), 5'-bisphosphate nucleotidase
LQVIAKADPNALGPSLLDELSSIVSRAGAAILAIRAESLRVRAKADDSPVTAADQASEAVMMEGISRLLPGVSVVSEEAVAISPPTSLSDTFVLVDPLDGTRELIAGRDEFTINVAVVIDGSPRLGIVAAPARSLLWRGIEGRGAERLVLATGAPAKAARERTAIRTRPCSPSGLSVVVSRSHLDARTAALLTRLPVIERIACGSAVKFCQLAEGAADFYPRLSTTCEWDVAAGHAVLAAAGGLVVTPEGNPLAYGRVEAELRVPAFLAWGDPSAARTFALSPC